MADDSPNIDAAAEALWCAIWEGDGAWDEATDSEKQTARGWAQAAIDGVGLRPERSIALETNNWIPIRTGAYEAPNSWPITRWVSPWVRVDGGDA